MNAAMLTMNAAILTMIAALLVSVLASARDQRRFAVETGEKLNELNSKYERLDASFAEHRRTTEKQHEQLRNDFVEHKRTTEKNHAEVTGSLSDARERLARIEGHLRIGLPPAAPPEPGQ